MKKLYSLFFACLSLFVLLGGNFVAAADPTPQATSVNCSTDKLVNGICRMDVYNMLGIRQGDPDPKSRTSVLTFVQDAVLGATFFIGTVVVLAFVVSGVMFVFAKDSGLKTKARQGIIYAIVGMVLVTASYMIIRLVQYVAHG
jgi:hypothetical protein